MDWITITWPMVAAACLTLGLIQLRIAIAQPPRAARLLLSFSAFAMAGTSAIELGIMLSDNLTVSENLLRALELNVGVVLTLLTAFIWVYFGTGKSWLAVAVPGIYSLGFFQYFTPTALVTFDSVTGLKTVTAIGGANFNVITGHPNAWNIVSYLAVLILIVFVIDASIRLAKNGNRHRATTVGGGVVFFLLVSGLQSALVDSEMIQMPYMISWAYIAILVSMAAELNKDVLNAAILANKIQETQRQTELVTAAADIGLWQWDIANDTHWADNRTRRLFGIDESAPLSFSGFINVIHPDDRLFVEKAFENAMQGSGNYAVEYRIVFAEQQIRWIAAHGKVEYDSSGKPLRLRGVVHNITTRREAELELHQLRNQLAHASRVSMVGQLASALTHELSQPLGAILRNTEAAELSLENTSPDLDELRAILADIRRDDERAGNVISNLRTLLKHGRFTTAELSINQALSNLAALIASDAVTRKIDLQIIAEPDLPTINGNAVQIQQVLLNLVLNAMDAVESLSQSQRKVLVQARYHPEPVETIEVRIEDTGAGIAPEQLDQLFEPFSTSKANGMGIGLSISRTIIEAHGGKISGENNPAGGATFRFSLPLIKRALAT